jgi:hypothetical protein
MSDDAEIDFFGAHIRVKSAKLAALLNSAVTDDVAVFGKRAIDLVGIEPRGERLRDEGQGDDDLSAVRGGAPAPRAGLATVDEANDSLDRMFARPWAPS